MKKKFYSKKNFVYLLFLVTFLLGVYWQWFLPGPRVANDFPLVSDALLKSLVDFPQTWSEKGAEGLGEYAAFFLWSWPLTFISGFLATIDFSFIAIERVLIILPFLMMGIFGMWKFGEHLNLSNAAKFILSVFYLVNTYILLVIDGGQLSIGLAYGWFPISFLAIEKAVSGGLKEKIMAGLAVTVLGFFDVRFILVLFLLSLIRFFYELLYLDRKKWGLWILGYLKTGTVSALVVFLLNAYWLYPLAKAPILQSNYTFFTQTSFSSFVNLGHSMLALAPHWFVNVFGKVTPLRFEFIFIPILAFLAAILRPKNRDVGFWLLVAAVSIFLTKGTSDPLPQVYSWLFSNIPGFSLFRDSTKFFFLITLSYALLIGITTDEIIKKIKAVRIKVIFISILIFYLLFLIRPVWLGQMTGTFSDPPFQQQYLKLSKILENDKSFGRVFWIPTLPALGYVDLNHPRVEAARLVQKRTFAIGTIGTYEIFNFLREAPFMGEIFNIAGIKYIAYPPLDPRRDDLDNSEYYYLFSDQLSNLPWLSKVEESLIPLWQTKSSQDRFFIANNVWWVIGSDNIYHQATKSANLRLSSNALIFSEEHAGLGKAVADIPSAKIVLNNKTIVDLAASFINENQLIFPAKKLSFDPDVTSGWWKREAKDLIRWREFLQTKYGIDNQDFDLGGGWAVGEGNIKYQISNIKYQKDSVLLARVLESTRSGQLKFYQGDNFVGEINTKNDGNNVRWFEVGKLASDSKLVIESKGAINVVNALAILDEDEWISYKNKAEFLQNRIVDFNEVNAKNTKSSVSYQKINPTKYRINIRNLEGGSFLIFSQTYDNLWKLDGRSSVPVYSLLNGFKVDKDGEYIVEFEVQKYVYPGLVISSTTLIIVILLLIKPSKPRKFHI